MKKAIIGIDLGGTNIKAVLMDEVHREILDSQILPTRSQAGVPQVVDDIALAILTMKGRAEEQGFRAAAVGIGAAGLVAEGIVRNSPNLAGWQDSVPLKRLLERRLAKHNLSLIIENDANAFVLAEQSLGAARGSQNVIGLTLGTGVGGGIIIEGRLFRGASSGAGEIGHMVIKHDGPKCKCGNRGCLEALVGASSIINRYHDLRFRAHQKIEKYLTVEELAKRAKKNDPLAKQAFMETGIILGAGLSNLVNIFNPQAIVIGGGVALSGSLIMKPAILEMKARAMPHNVKNVRVLRSKLGSLAGAIGSALIAITN